MKDGGRKNVQKLTSACRYNEPFWNILTLFEPSCDTCWWKDCSIKSEPGENVHLAHVSKSQARLDINHQMWETHQRGTLNKSSGNMIK